MSININATKRTVVDERITKKEIAEANAEEFSTVEIDVSSYAPLVTPSFTGSVNIDGEMNIKDINDGSNRLRVNSDSSKGNRTFLYDQITFAHGLYHGYVHIDNNVGTELFKILRYNTWYWGKGGTIIEMYRTSYSGFQYSKFMVSGHTNGANASTPVLTTIIDGGIGAPYFEHVIFQSTGTTVNDGTNSQGYSRLVFNVPSYQDYKFIIHSHTEQRLLLADGSNYIWDSNKLSLYPHNTRV